MTDDQKVAWRVAMLAASSVVLMAAPKAWWSADCWVGPMAANLDSPKVANWAACWAARMVEWRVSLLVDCSVERTAVSTVVLMAEHWADPLVGWMVD